MAAPNDPENRDPFEDPDRPPLADPPSMTNPDGSPNRDFGSESMEWHRRQLERVDEEHARSQARSQPGWQNRMRIEAQTPDSSGVVGMEEVNEKIDRIIELLEGVLV
tara:strand:+ start:218 stop:538 length:321 start_codon:yes stop_codon:yes gene_type:complete